MYPTLEAVMEIAAEGSYGRIPVVEEMYADRFTPVEVMRTLRAASRHCYLLESAENNQKWGRYSFMGYSPVMEITCNDGEMTVTTGAEDGCKEKSVIKTRHPKKAVREILKKVRDCRTCQILPVVWWDIFPMIISVMRSRRFRTMVGWRQISGIWI